MRHSRARGLTLIEGVVLAVLSKSLTTDEIISAVVQLTGDPAGISRAGIHGVIDRLRSRSLIVDTPSTPRGRGRPAHAVEITDLGREELARIGSMAWLICYGPAHTRAVKWRDSLVHLREQLRSVEDRIAFLDQLDSLGLKPARRKLTRACVNLKKQVLELENATMAALAGSLERKPVKLRGGGSGS